MTDPLSPRHSPSINARNVAIVIFDDVQVLDFTGPLEVFSAASAELPRTPARPYAPYFISLVGLSMRDVRTVGGMVVTPACTFRDCPAPDLLIVPGGPGSRALLTHSEFLGWLRVQSERVEHLASVCTGALSLAAAGLLRGRRATTHHTSFAQLQALEEDVEVVRDQRYVRDGNVWTSGGISAGIDMSLALVRETLGDDRFVVEEMEWMWHLNEEVTPQ